MTDSLKNKIQMILEEGLNEDIITIPATASFGTNAPDFNNKNIGVDSTQDIIMSFFDIKRDFYYTMFKYESGYFLVGLGKRDGTDTFRLVMAASDKPSENWKDYSFAKQYKRTGLLWLNKEPKIQKISNPRELYGTIGRIAVCMIENLNVEKLVLNGYTERMTQLFSAMFKSKSVSKLTSELNFNVSFKGTWIVVSKTDKSGEA